MVKIMGAVIRPKLWVVGIILIPSMGSTFEGIMTQRLAITTEQQYIMTQRLAITLERHNIMTQRLAITLE